MMAATSRARVRAFAVQTATTSVAASTTTRMKRPSSVSGSAIVRKTTASTMPSTSP